MNTVTVELPWPPSANRYWRSFRGRMVISKEAKEFKSEVTYRLSKLPAKNAFFDGRVGVKIRAYPPDKRKRDLDNLIKITLDSLQKSSPFLEKFKGCGGLFKDDAQVDSILITRCAHVKGGALSVEVYSL
jgi:crossover junction endodeoxyribonuclease RusA